MANKRLTTEEKAAELEKYHCLLQATIDYHLEIAPLILTNEAGHTFDPGDNYRLLKLQCENHFQKRRLTMLKRWFSNMMEPFVENSDLQFSNYLRSKTGYDIDILAAFRLRVDKIVAKGKITTDNQFYEINTMVNDLWQSQPVAKQRIDTLNKLLIDYQERKEKAQKRKMAVKHA
jgi:hypothetical protein